MGTMNYGGRGSIADGYKKITITQTDIASMLALGVEQFNGPVFRINLSMYNGEFAHHPLKGEEWIIRAVMNQWVLDRRTSFQNQTTSTILASNPGTTVFSNHGKLQFVDTQVEIAGAPLIVSGVERPIPITVFNVTSGSQASNANLFLTGWTRDATSTNITQFTHSAGTFTCKKAGVYAANYRVSVPTITTGRSFLEMYKNGTTNLMPRRSMFSLDNFGYLGSIFNMNVGDTLICNAYHTSASAQVITARLELIGLV